MATQPTPAAPRVPLEEWEPIHPAAAAFAVAESATAPGAAPRAARSASLAHALADANRRWGNPVDGELSRWLAGADAVVTGQQPGLLGGPLLTLVKAAAVVGEVRRRRTAGREAVGFLWLATADDDLPEMGWGRVAVGEELLEVREPEWTRAAALGGRTAVGSACEAFVDALRAKLPGENAAHALDLARRCYAPGTLLGEATATFLSGLLSGTGIVLVDALEAELARAAAATTGAVLEELPACWDAFAATAATFKARGWSVPLRISPQKLPVFRRSGNGREPVAAVKGACPAGVLAEHARHPERFVPNAWLRPLAADAALGTSVSILGGAELAYHIQTEGARAVAATARPEWRLRPHVTIVTPAERRLVSQLRVGTAEILHQGVPLASLPGKATRRRIAQMRAAMAKRMEGVSSSAREEIPGLVGDVEATDRKLEAAVAWLEGRLAAAAARDAETTMGRWRKVRAFLRPDGQPQERRLSVLAPLLKLGVEWPARLADSIDPGDPGMHLLFWGEGGPW